MDKHKIVYQQPIITDYDVFSVVVYLPRKGKDLVYHMVVTDSAGDMKFCESFPQFQDVKQRIANLEFDLQLEDYSE